MPASDDLRAVQVAVFDNGSGRPFRYGLNLKAWAGAGKISMTHPTFNANVTLWPRDKAVAQTLRLTRPQLLRPLSEEMVDMVTQILDMRHEAYVWIMKVQPAVRTATGHIPTLAAIKR